MTCDGDAGKPARFSGLNRYRGKLIFCLIRWSARILPSRVPATSAPLRNLKLLSSKDPFVIGWILSSKCPNCRPG